MHPSQPIRYKDLVIPQPCAENWEAMEPRKDGAYCNRCQKEVVDFTFKTERELNEIIASGKWTGCGRFLERQLGKVPVVASPLVQMRRAILERWRNGAAAAVLLVGLWQIPTLGKAEPKAVVCLVPQPLAPDDEGLKTEPNYILSAILLSEYGENLPDDFLISLRLPSGDTIPITTQQGFFGINLEGRAKPEDTIVITVPPQAFEDESHKSKYEFTEFRVRLADGQNLERPIHAIFRNNLLVVTHVSGGPMYSSPTIQNLAPIPLVVASVPVDRYSKERSAPEPLFKTKTPEEKAEARATKEERKSSGSNRP